MRALRVATSAILAISFALFAVRPAPAQETIRVGFLGPLTGVFAQAGKDMDDGLKFAFEQVNYQVAGRKIELFWTYSPQEFLKLPLYSRDYPPARP